MKLTGHFVRDLLVSVVLLCLLAAAGAASAPADDNAASALVSVGSAPDLVVRNMQTEPAVAVDASRPDVLAAGANDLIDVQPCVGRVCKGPGRGVGSSGVYFSFDRGGSWVQPTYTGLTERDCSPTVLCSPQLGPIGTLPWYFQSGLRSTGDPALAFGPRPLAGKFSWANGSRLYYANLAVPLLDEPNTGPTAVAVSRIDNPTAESINEQSNWKPPLIAATRSSAVTLEDKDQIWADNAASSPFFGTVYVCWTNYIPDSTNGARPIMVSVSRDGGESWTQKQVTDASGTEPLGFRQFCTLRTDSHGVVYLAYLQRGDERPAMGQQMLAKSFDGGDHWTRPQPFLEINNACYKLDPIQNRCTYEGPWGARSGSVAAPSLDIANGAPSGIDASDELVVNWSDGRDGLNHELSLLSHSTDGGASWSTPERVSLAADRSLYTAPAISPDGTSLYLVYMAYQTDYQTDLTNPRLLHSVFRRAAIDPSGAPTGWTTLVDGPAGDDRGGALGPTGSNFAGDYVYVAATRDYGTGVTTDLRNAADCPAFDAWRMSLLTPTPLPFPRLNDPSVCPPDRNRDFGNSDIYAFTNG
jgi:hypothetical protein